MPCQANAEVFGLAGFRPIEIAKIAMSNDAEASVKKATLNDQSLLTVDQLLVDGFVVRDHQIIRAESGRWENHLSAAYSVVGSASGESKADSSERGASLLILVREKNASTE
jgi:hypothetical protein